MFSAPDACSASSSRCREFKVVDLLDDVLAPIPVALTIYTNMCTIYYNACTYKLYII